ncbi:acyl-CoA dehydratase activase-related protein [Calderihabitans maritimus]|uniref:2-hydroxyglutaryl-CoA dehydratase n=1 Tax=Calderihabitans maritimus TaxID=1246530 RepID=A0A1Z5HY53_9FIRM|nr:acyl-CoA dehydratase activase-related protein [Calderihabitans maritimus]GAW94245.1 2-hydroxyglutaryl-CoA dehydratase [Calderihabitans maritimus]
MNLRIGYPATLSYYTYFPFWKAFFEQLGCSFIVSPPTTKAILDQGVRETVSDACVPIKLFHGHVLALKDKVDYLFLPRMVSVTRFSTFCPKFLGLPNMVRYSIDHLPKLIDDRIDLKKGRMELFRVCQKIGRRLGCTFGSICRAYVSAINIHKRYEKLLWKGFRPSEGMVLCFQKQGRIPEKVPATGGIELAVLGYPYEVYDPYVSVGLLKKLDQMGCRVWTVEMVPRRDLYQFRKVLPKNLFWYYSNRVIWATYYYLKRGNIDGLIHVTAFGCGPDAMVGKLMELEARKRGVPFMTLTIDEHTGDAGVQTRLEAFVDMIKYRRERH